MIIENQAMITGTVRSSLHFVLSTPGGKTLVTQVFADDAKHLDAAVTFGVVCSLVAHFERKDMLDGAPDGLTAPGICWNTTSS